MSLLTKLKKPRPLSRTRALQTETLSICLPASFLCPSSICSIIFASWLLSAVHHAFKTKSEANKSQTLNTCVVFSIVFWLQSCGQNTTQSNTFCIISIFVRGWVALYDSNLPDARHVSSRDLVCGGHCEASTMKAAYGTPWRGDGTTTPVCSSILEMISPVGWTVNTVQRITRGSQKSL